MGRLSGRTVAGLSYPERLKACEADMANWRKRQTWFENAGRAGEANFARHRIDVLLDIHRALLLEIEVSK